MVKQDGLQRTTVDQYASAAKVVCDFNLRTDVMTLTFHL